MWWAFENEHKFIVLYVALIKLIGKKVNLLHDWGNIRKNWYVNSTFGASYLSPETPLYLHYTTKGSPPFQWWNPASTAAIIWFWITEELTTLILRPFVKWWKRSTIFLLFSQSIFSFGPHILWVRFWFLLIYKAAAKRSFHLPIIEMPYLDNHTTLLFAQFLPVKNGN